jgi:Domain of unknown function (DUF4288)
MGHIPKNAKWYLAEIVEEIKISGESTNVIHINMRLVRADSPQEAYDAAIRLGKDSDRTYENTDGKPVNIVFRGLRDLMVIHDELEHGAELFYDEQVGLSEEQLAKLICPRNELSVFLPIPPPSGPNYFPLSIWQELEAYEIDEDFGGGKP